MIFFIQWLELNNNHQKKWWIDRLIDSISKYIHEMELYYSSVLTDETLYRACNEKEFTYN